MRSRRFAALAMLAWAGCSAPGPARPGAAAAALSLAADERMITVPAGRYVAGSTPEERGAAYDDYQTSSGRDVARTGKWFELEEDRHSAVLPGFQIDLMPVTQAQYAELVLAGGAPAPTIDEATWKALGFTQDFATEVQRFVWHDGRPPSGREDHPVVLVTWAEADRYCAWRGQRRGEARRLPTAAEYEKASRGDNGLSYPWGNTFEPSKLDSAVNGPHDTVPAGTFIDGASPYGVLDLAGNVFEWTGTPLALPQMIVKGSAWDDYGGVGRGASRHSRAATVRHVIIGFRCAADLP